MRVDYGYITEEEVEDGYRSMYMMLIHETFLVKKEFQLRIQIYILT